MSMEIESKKPKVAGEILMIPNDQIIPNPNQPRKTFDQNELVNLAISIRMNGILQPLTVRKVEKGYELIAGERRLRASRLAGLPTVPCILIQSSSSESAVYSLIENIQRQDLDFFDESFAIRKLLEEHQISREEITRLLGKSASTIANKLRLLNLSEIIQQKIRTANLTERHARALLRIEPNEREEILEQIIKKEMTVAQAEAYIEAFLQNKSKPHRQTVKLFSDVRIFVNTVNKAVETMQTAGIPAICKRHDTQEAFCYEIVIPKNVQSKKRDNNL